MPHELDPMDRIQPVVVTTRVIVVALAAVMLALILSHFPSAAGVTHWIEQRRQHIEHLRQLSH
jgi:hypothetical protein